MLLALAALLLAGHQLERVRLGTARPPEGAVPDLGHGVERHQAGDDRAADEQVGQEAARLRAGTVNVNEGYATGWGTHSSPMGGFGDSGLGRRHGIEGLLKYTEAQTVATQRIIGFGGPPMLTKKQWAEALVLIVKGLKLAGKK